MANIWALYSICSSFWCLAHLNSLWTTINLCKTLSINLSSLLGLEIWLYNIQCSTFLYRRLNSKIQVFIQLQTFWWTYKHSNNTFNLFGKTLSNTWSVSKLLIMFVKYGLPISMLNIFSSAMVYWFNYSESTEPVCISSSWPILPLRDHSPCTSLKKICPKLILQTSKHFVVFAIAVIVCVFI